MLPNLVGVLIFPTYPLLFSIIALPRVNAGPRVPRILLNLLEAFLTIPIKFRAQLFVSLKLF
jgi:hypothetical protein